MLRFEVSTVRYSIGRNGLAVEREEQIGHCIAHVLDPAREREDCARIESASRGDVGTCESPQRQSSRLQ